MKNIMIVTFLSLFVMSILINLGVPILIVVGVFLLSIYLLIMWRSGSVRYDLFSWGFTQHLSPTFNKNRRIKRVFVWDDVKSYQAGIDMNRRKQEYNYLKLSLRKSPDRIQIEDTDSDMDAFMSFRQAFIEQMESYNASPDSVAPESVPTVRLHKPIKRRTGFYKTFTAKAFTLVMIVFSLVLVGYVIVNMGDVRRTNMFRIFAVILPGTLYMVYRVFWMKGE